MPGIPKPIVLPQGFLCVAEAMSNAPPENGVKCLWKVIQDMPGRILSPFPMFHVRSGQSQRDRTF
jgi:hypothetical protein